MTVVAVLGASFSLRENEPNPCNGRIAVQLILIVQKLLAQGHAVVIVVQWEVDLALRQYGFMHNGKLFINGGEVVVPYRVVGQSDDGGYLDTKGLYAEAVPFFRDHGVTSFVGVANAFIHQPYLYWMARKDFKLLCRRVRGIGFDKQSTQWWCRSWWQFAFQTVRLALGFSRGHNGRQVKA